MKNKNLVIAIVLMTLILWGGMYIQNLLSPPQSGEVSRSETADVVVDQNASVLPVGDITISPPVTYQNNIMRVRFDSQSATISSLELLQYDDGGSSVQMIIPEFQPGQDISGMFDISFGNIDAKPVHAGFAREYSSDKNTIIFYRDFVIEGSEDPFRISKIYRFMPDEYLFEFEIAIRHSVNEYIPLAYDSYAYTLHVGPQIGPKFEKLDQRTEYRRFSYLRREKRKEEKIPKTTKSITDQVTWIGINGKYFAAIIVPDAKQYQITLAGESLPSVKDRASIYISRPIVRSSVVSDIFRVYVGPKVRSVLSRYDEADKNAFNVQDLNFTKITDSRILFGWLEAILKILLQALYKVIPNYGVAIILLTIVVKILLLPLTNKSMNSAARMQKLNPKVTALRSQFANDPTRLNKELSELYKREHVNPLSGCLPVLIQFPFFIAMFGLFSNHFDLRGATFISGWIDDLSIPEQILSFNFTIPLLGWDSLRLLPIIFVVSQILTAELTATASASGTSNKQAQFMKYGLPIIFFFILYNMPAGLLVYWIFSNIISLVQQIVVRRIKQRG